MKLKSDRKNYVIIALCAILLVMSIGYAAFSSLLTINGTASLTDSFCVGFDNTKTSTYVPTAGISGGTLPTGSMSYSGTACSTKYQPNSSLSATFKQPGDKIEYTLTIANKSTFTAAIKSIKVENENVTSNKVVTKGNIKYTVEMPESTTLAVDAETTMKVIAEFQNDTDIEKFTGTETQTLSVEINAQQDDGTGGFTPTPAAQTVYAWNTTGITVGTSKLSDLASYKTAQPYYTSAADVMSASGYSIFNKYTVVNDTITEGYSCQTFNILGLEPVCLKMSTDGSTYGNDTTGNVGILKALQSNSTFTGNSPAYSFEFGSAYSSCTVRYSSVMAESDGKVQSNAGSDTCYVEISGNALCYLT